MANRMEIELTSARDDSFTWRAAGARQPKGTIGNTLLPPGSKVGDVVRVEADVEMDGITILSVLPPKLKAPLKGHIEHLGSSRPVAGVTTAVGASPRPHDRPAGADRPRRANGRRPEGAHGGRGERSRPLEGGSEPSGGARPARGRRSSDRRGASSGGARPDVPGRSTPAAGGPAAGRGPARRAPARFEPGNAHRTAFLEGVAPEERPVADRLVRGGLPGVRRAIAEEQARARAEGRPVLSGDPLIEIAERLLPGLQAASWLDRAEAAAAMIDEISLRDLRMTVTSAVAKDEAARGLEKLLREGLDRRVEKLRSGWHDRIEQALGKHRILQALSLSGRPPEPAARFPADLVEALVAQASQAMTADTAPEEWLALLEAASASPLRRQIRPTGIPSDESGEVVRRARLAAGRLPALAALLGMAMPPPPQPSGAAAGHNRPRPGRVFRASSRGGTAGRRSGARLSSSVSAPGSKAVLDEEVEEA